MPHKCRHRMVEAAYVPGTDPTFTIPPDCGPLDGALEYLCSKDPEVDEVIVNAMELVMASPRARTIISSTQELLENTPPIDTESVAKVTHELSLLVTLGFLSGTAIGFAAGLQFEEASDDEDDEGPDYDGPMV